MRAHSSLRLGTLRGTTPELLASPWYCAWGFCMVWEAGLPHKTSSPLTQRRNGRACSSLTARGGGLPVGVTPAIVSVQSKCVGRRSIGKEILVPTHEGPYRGHHHDEDCASVLEGLDWNVRGGFARLAYGEK